MFSDCAVYLSTICDWIAAEVYGAKTYKLQYGAHMHNQRFLQLPKSWSVITI